MKFIDTEFPEVKLISSDIFSDLRGCFFGVYEKDLFSKNGIDENFSQDSISYSEGNGVKEAYFLAIDKQHGNIALTRVHDMEMINAKERVQYLKGALDSKTVPDRCYSDIPEGVSGNRKLAIGCVFCPHKRECWSDANNGKGLRAFKYEKGTTYLSHVAKEPRVQEIINW